jgi:hypothetical protein
VAQDDRLVIGEIFRGRPKYSFLDFTSNPTMFTPDYKERANITRDMINYEIETVKIISAEYFFFSKIEI